MSHDLLERLFVARERTLARVIDRVKGAITSDERNHTLLVGPRGSGKTHLVSLAYYRARDLGAQVSWLPEDPWTIVSYQRLLREIAGRLEPTVEGALPTSVEELEALLVNRANSNGPIVVIVENLDQVLAALRNKGQQHLRHLLQAHRPFLFVASTTRIDRWLSDQAEPFYSWFTTTRLEPFDSAEAATMLATIAAENGDAALVSYLSSDEGLRRLETIAHLAGGQPRVWALLASALDVTRLDELIELLLERFDDLTPYYQEQLARLSPHQRLVVAELAEADRPINVADLAQRLDVNQRSLSKTTRELVERGWIAPTTSRLTAQLDGRRTYYELAEPLVRISFQIKESRGEPLRLVVEFLKHWFDRSQLVGPDESIAGKYLAMAMAGQDSDAIVAVTRRLRDLPATLAPAVELLGEIDDALAALQAGNPEPLLYLPTPIRAALESRLETEALSDVRADVHDVAQEEFGDAPDPAMETWLLRTERWVRSAPGNTPSQVTLVGWLASLWRFEEAKQALQAAIEMQNGERANTVLARIGIAIAYVDAGRFVDAAAEYERTLGESRRAVGPEHPLTLGVSLNLAATYQAGGRHADAMRVHEHARADAERVLGLDHAVTLRLRNNTALQYASAGRLEESIPMQERTLAGCERVLGARDPVTMTARHNLGSLYQRADRFADAARVLSEALRDRISALGADHPDVRMTRSRLTEVERAL
jgi:tetratricopeptide (TPR) repeat protein